ncbi:serine hydrolase [Amnibacterium sp.]|uniref:serine hydrolase domain-containing protein n=1 Tax=Amnibacterium sp. TaxID=1872496 RepID=UPI00260A150F|nr:serine hydrolase domain-containing protein [Amnibacterium sp.]MCU1474101.1 beta-lactamase family protein [Amnibacterium sp.]
MQYDTSRAALSAPAIDDLLAARVKDGRTPSVAYALVADGRIVHTGGFADEAVTPVPGPDTAFRIASCTKSFTAVAMLQQRDAGRLDLDAPVSEYLPLATVPEAFPRVAQLASMAAGFPTDDPWGDRQESLPLDQFDRMAAAGFRLIDRPGARFEYSNLGYALLGRVLERVSGRRYVDLVREDVLTPLGLRGIGYDRSVEAPGGVATGFARFGGRWEPQPFAGPGAFSPIGGVFATPRALATWVAWLADAWRPAAPDAVLAAASRRDAQTARIPIEDVGSYGYGLFLDEHPRHGLLVSHSGGYPGYGSHMRWHAGTGLGIVVLENARYSGAGAPAARALELVLDQIGSPETVPDVWPETVAARETVERLLRRWDGATADALFAENVALDEPIERRRATIEALTARAGVAADAHVLPLEQAAPSSRTPAHLAWTVPGATGALRVEVRLTPELRPTVQTLTVRLG